MLRLAAYAGSPRDVCAYGVLEVAEIWNDTKAEEIERAVASLDLPYGASTWSSAERRLDDYSEQWASTHRKACEATHVRAEQSEAMLDARMQCLSSARVELHETVAVLSTMRPELVLRLSALLGGLPPLEACSNLEWLTNPNRTPPAPLREDVDRVNATLVRVRAAIAEGNTGSAEELLEGVRETAEDSEFEPLEVSFKLAESRLLEALDRFDDSCAILEIALHDALELGRTDLAARATIELMRVVNYGLNKPEEALRLEPVGRALSARDGHTMARFYDVLALVQNRAGDTKAALATADVALDAFRRAFGPDAYATQRAIASRATILRAAGHVPEAEAAHREVLAIRVAELGTSHPDVARTHNNLANVLAIQNKLADAQTHFEKAIEALTAVYGPTHTAVIKARANLATLLVMQKKHDAAYDELHWVVEQKKRVFGEEHKSVAMSLGTLGILELSLGRFDDALQTQFRARKIRRKVLGPEHPDLVLSETNLGEVYLTMNEADEAVKHYEEALRLRVLSVGSDSRLADECRVSLATALYDAERFEEATAALDEAGGVAHDETASERLRLRASLLRALLDARSMGARATGWRDAVVAIQRLEMRVQASSAFDSHVKARWARRVALYVESPAKP